MVKQGDIISVQLNPTQGHEQQGFRPCVCLSNDVVFKFSNVIIVAPISNTQRDYPFYFNLNGYHTSGKILLDQIRTIDPKARKIKHIEKLRNDDLEDILHLSSFIFQK